MKSSQDITIRAASVDERPAIQELTLQAYVQYKQMMTPRAWAGLKQALLAALSSKDPVEYLVAEREGKLLGSVLLFPPSVDAYAGLVGEANWPEVRLLAVAPEARGNGIGRALVEECIRRARQSGATALGLHTSQSMAVAMQMYERMGFVRIPEYDFQPSEDELVLAYRLSLNEPMQEQRAGET